MTDDAPRKGGRKPFQWDYAEIRKLAAIGLTQEEVAETLGTTHATWFLHIQKGNTEISEAYQAGRSDHRKLVFGSLAKQAAKGDRQCAMFLAKAHFNRRETSNVIVQGDPDNPITVEHTRLSPAQRKARIAELEKKKEALHAQKESGNPGATSGSEDAQAEGKSA